MSADLKKGEVVKLKSGGPLMTIEEVDRNYVYCKWFAGDELKQSEFDAESLVLSSE